MSIKTGNNKMIKDKSTMGQYVNDIGEPPRWEWNICPECDKDMNLCECPNLSYKPVEDSE